MSGDEGQLDLEAQDPGAIAHESSSQSSQENGDPHTPSPLYSEALVTKAEQNISPEMQKTLNMDNVDPHFARLLSSLSLSVSKPAGGSALDPLVPATNDGIQTSPLGSPTKLAATNTRSPSHASTAKLSRPARTPSVVPHTPPSVSMTSLRVPSRLGHTSSPRNSAGSFVGQRTPGMASNGTANELLPSPTTRRVSAPVDISPYLSRAATAAPPVPKQLKYISMLENVAKESERMTPKIERQLMVQGNYLSSTPARPPITPSHSTPGTLYGSNPEPSIIYSSSQHQSRNFPPPSLPSFPQISSDDAFVVRPRTSSTFHPVSSVSSRPSLTEDQLHLMMSNTGPRPPSLPPVGPYQLSLRRPGPPSGPPFITQGALSASRTQPNLRLVPPHQLPSAPFIEAPPLSAPALSPTFHLIPRANPTNNAQLLSILNTPSLPRATSSTSQTVLNNLGP
ncbi:hypothetical protein BDY19DRAFT_48864 [Irpex rosettiformis]|uniref:Uncharacterized protein n=1 Tax=Irpex rosettiformis TaxID=378272 RepID=A0ACB8UL73_9APHY|nr:hypothetical protein BDY19DRAFT_48864 [Irpex rosettiformis]